MYYVQNIDFTKWLMFHRLGQTSLNVNLYRSKGESSDAVFNDVP